MDILYDTLSFTRRRHCSVLAEFVFAEHIVLACVMGVVPGVVERVSVCRAGLLGR